MDKGTERFLELQAPLDKAQEASERMLIERDAEEITDLIADGHEYSAIEKFSGSTALNQVVSGLTEGSV